MKQLLFCYKQDRKLRVRYTILTDVFVPVQDIISPQKTTLTVAKTNKIELGDIIIIRDNNSGKIEYIGYIETLSNKINTELSCYPLINVFDNDYVLDQQFKPSTNEDGTSVDIDVDIVEWLSTQLKRAFLDTKDSLQALPLIIRKHTSSPVLYKRTLDTANLLEAYIDVFINTGVYIEFSELSYNGYEIEGIYCDIYCNTDKKAYALRWDNPLIQSVDIVDDTFTNYNKMIATEQLPEGVTTREPQRYYFYLLDNNSITREPDDSVREQEEVSKGLAVGSLGRRIKQVRSKAITFEIDEESTGKEVAEALLLRVYSELQAPEYNLQITIEMLKNDNIKLYRRVDFLAESGIMYSSNITKIERLNDLQVRITLGALRNSLTDFKKKVEAI